VSQSEATRPLVDAVALWEVSPTIGADEVIAAAVDALVAGVDSPSLRELAGISAKESYWTVRPLVVATFDELEIPYPGPGRDEIEIAAACVMCQRLLDGRLTARDLAIWAHRTIGHEGAARLRPIAVLDDVYDVSGCDGDTAEELEVVARAAAKSLLAGEPLPARAAPNQPDERAASVGIETRFRSALRRLRLRLGR
jgi:hypothetical protein